jgi:hypothetical protein
MRDLDTVDSELRLLAAVRRCIRENGGQPSSRHVDELLDEGNELTGSWRRYAVLSTKHERRSINEHSPHDACPGGRCRWHAR